MKVNRTSKIDSVEKLLKPENRTGMKGKSGDAETGEDSVVLSSETSEIARLAGEIDKVPDTRPEKIERVRQELQQGSYQLRAEQIAEELLKEASQTGGGGDE